MDLLIWGGPVMRSNLDGIDWGSTKPRIEVFSSGPGGGIGSSSFAALAESMRDASGHVLPNLLASRGLRRDQFDKVAIAGFSAFHGLASALLDADADMIDAAFLLDACFSSVSPTSWTKRGYVDFGARAAKRDKVLVYTASAGGGPGGQYPSSTGSECMLANLKASSQKAGVTLSSYIPPAPMPMGDGLRAGALVGIDYGPQFSSGFTHADLINRIGVQTMQAFAAPFFAGTLGFGWPSWARWTLTALGVAAALGTAAVVGMAVAEGKMPTLPSLPGRRKNPVVPGPERWSAADQSWGVTYRSTDKGLLFDAYIGTQTEIAEELATYWEDSEHDDAADDVAQHFRKLMVGRKVLYLSNVEVETSFRRQGHARRGLIEALEDAYTRGVRQAWLYACNLWGKTDPVPVWKALGFEVVMHAPGSAAACAAMKLDITPSLIARLKR